MKVARIEKISFCVMSAVTTVDLGHFGWQCERDPREKLRPCLVAANATYLDNGGDVAQACPALNWTGQHITAIMTLP